MGAKKKENHTTLVGAVLQKLPHRDAWQDANLSRTEVDNIVTSIFDTITDWLVDGKEVHIKNFGRFKTMLHTEKRLNLPDGGTKIIPPRMHAKFKQFKKLRDALYE